MLVELLIFSFLVYPKIPPLFTQSLAPVATDVHIHSPISDSGIILLPSETPTPSPSPTVTPTPRPRPTKIPTPSPTAILPTIQVHTPTDLDELFARFSREYGTDKELLKRIAHCESGFNSQARNGIYSGMFQFAETSWKSARSLMGADTNLELRFNAEEAIKTASYMLARGQQNAWRNCIQ